MFEVDFRFGSFSKTLRYEEDNFFVYTRSARRILTDEMFHPQKSYEYKIALAKAYAELLSILRKELQRN